MKCPNEALGAKTSPEIALSSFCFGYLLVDMGLALTYSLSIQLYSIGGNWLVLCVWLVVSCRYLSETEATVCFPSRCWEPIWLEHVQALCQLPQSLGGHLCISSIISEKHCFLGVFPYWLLQSFFLLFYMLSWGLREAVWWRPPVWDWFQWSRTLCMLSSSGGPIYCKRKASLMMAEWNTDL